MLTDEQITLINDTTKDLSSSYPIDAAYSSKASLWRDGLADGSVTRELYDAAKDYYGRLWNYTGD